MPVSEIMTPQVVSISCEDTIEHMQSLLRLHKIHHLLVLDEGKLVGVVSDRDILRIVSPFINTKAETEKDKFTLSRKASQLALKKPITIKGSASKRQAAASLLENGISLLPVVDDSDKVIGVLSWKDVMRFLTE